MFKTTPTLRGTCSKCAWQRGTRVSAMRWVTQTVAGRELLAASQGCKATKKRHANIPLSWCSLSPFVQPLKQLSPEVHSQVLFPPTTLHEPCAKCVQEPCAKCMQEPCAKCMHAWTSGSTEIHGKGAQQAPQPRPLRSVRANISSPSRTMFRSWAGHGTSRQQSGLL